VREILFVLSYFDTERVRNTWSE